MLDNQPRRRPEPHSTARTTRSSGVHRLHLEPAAAATAGLHRGGERFDHDALMTTVQRCAKELACLVGVRRHDPVWTVRAPEPRRTGCDDVQRLVHRAGLLPSTCRASNRNSVSGVRACPAAASRDPTRRGRDLKRKRSPTRRERDRLAVGDELARPASRRRSPQPQAIVRSRRQACE